MNRPTIQFELPHRDQAMMDRILGIVPPVVADPGPIVRGWPHAHPYLLGHHAVEIMVEPAPGGGWRYTVSYAPTTLAISEAG